VRAISERSSTLLDGVLLRFRIARIQGVPTELSLGNLRKADETLGDAERLVDAILAARPADRRALFRGARIAHDRMIVAETERRNADAVTYSQRAVARIAAFVTSGPVDRREGDIAAMIYSNIALAHNNMHRYQEAVSYARRALDIAKAMELGPERTSQMLSVLALAMRLQGDLDGALAAIREARALADRIAYDDEATRMFNRYPILLREGLILGEDRAVSLARRAEAVASFREALQILEAVASREPNDATSRSRIGTIGRELGEILRWDRPEDALAAYDLALRRLREIANNVRARRDIALVLAGSSYALRRLGRTEEAERRISEALAILRETKDYPTADVPFDSPVRAVLQAVADHHAEDGDPARARREYEELIGQVTAARWDVENDLQQAHALSLLYQQVGHLQRLTGALDAAAATDAKRVALWRHWDLKRSQNPFVKKQLEELAATKQSVATRGTGSTRVASTP